LKICLNVDYSSNSHPWGLPFGYWQRSFRDDQGVSQGFGGKSCNRDENDELSVIPKKGNSNPGKGLPEFEGKKLGDKSGALLAEQEEKSINGL